MKDPFRQIHEQLRGKHPFSPSFLENVKIDGIRGLKELSIPFSYPVSVIAGQNASGKSTVLFALACAYRVPGAGVKSHVPSTLFPDFTPRKNNFPSDKREKTITLEYEYRHAQEHLSMRWRRGKSWNRSFFGRKGATQPERRVYLRALSNISNPSEVRGFLTLDRRSDISIHEIDGSLIRFAEQILPFKYKELTSVDKGDQKYSFLFARQGDDNEGGYSEFHMSGGERAILRLSLEISNMNNALILIDEVETGLHPHAQEKFMLQLQRLALRNNLQVVVTTHSSVVLDSVPREARVFLERTEDGVRRRQPYRDIIQNALYGRARDTLSILCEDTFSEYLLRGLLDHLALKLDFRLGRDVKIGHDTGSSEFRQHFGTLQKFGMEKNFLFVMDGDAETEAENMKKNLGLSEPPSLPAVMCLPGRECPEAWVWKRLLEDLTHYAEELGRDTNTFRNLMAEKEQLYDSAADKSSNIAKYRLASLAESLNHDSEDMARRVARHEASKKEGGFRTFVDDMEDVLASWRDPWG